MKSQCQHLSLPDLVEHLNQLKKSASEDDAIQSAKMIDMLQRLSKDRKVTLSFILGSAAKRVVKGLRGHANERVRRKAIELMQKWEKMVREGVRVVGKKKRATKAKKERNAANTNDERIRKCVHRACHDF
mmetsp:Transcript_21909/g.44392  ORF Transcript_21909/g.44392 Transcript_21909/m.44392 type:complete len:130 (-) Transcript_21909:482-871(-)